MSMQGFVQREFNKAKRKAVKIINNGYDTTEIIKSIENTRNIVGQELRVITNNEIAQVLAIRIYKNENI